MIFFQKLKLNRVVKNVVDPDVGLNEIWSLFKRDSISNLYSSCSSVDDFLIIFDRQVNQVIEKKKAELKNKNIDLKLEGRWLCFDPYLTMYDSLAESESSGFFDSGDVPPPEFWVSVESNILISFIPKKFLKYACLGVDNCGSDCLYWL